MSTSDICFLYIIGVDKTEDNMEKSLSYSDVLNTPIYLEFKEKFKWEKIFINTTHNLLARKMPTVRILM